MFSADSLPNEQLLRLEDELGFDYQGQDWGIVNADPRRVAEFVLFFERHYSATWSTWTVAEFVDLVLESASSAIREDPSFSVSCIDDFVARAAPLAPERVRYWTSHDFAVTPHLRTLGY
jgi:hypothetical protein